MAELGRLQNLTSLTMSFNVINLTFVMYKVFQQLKNLKKVEMYPPMFAECLVVALAENNPDLKVFRLFTIYPSLSDATIDVLIKSCPSLEEIILCSSQSESTIEKLSSSYPKMKRLEIRGSTGNLDEKLTKFIKKFTSLESLDVHGYKLNITDRGIERILSSAENLKHLGILKAPWVTNMFVERLKIKCPDLDLRINDY